MTDHPVYRPTPEHTEGCMLRGRGGGIIFTMMFIPPEVHE